MGKPELIRGEIRWYTFRLPDKRRPVLILARNDAADVLNEIIVVPVTRTIRGLATEVVLTSSDGMPTTCALNFDHLSLAQRDRVGASLCTLPDDRWLDVERALLTALRIQRRTGTLNEAGQLRLATDEHLASLGARR